MTPDYIAAQQYARPMVARMLRWSDDVDDVLQDATVKAITKLHEFRGDCQFRTWYCRIAINMALMRMRRHKQFCEVPLDLPSEELEPDAMAIAVERKERLMAAVSHLSPVLQREFRSYLDGESTKVSAARRGVTEEATKGSRFRIREKLRVALEGVV